MCARVSPVQFIVDGCDLEVNLDSRTRTALVKRVREGNVEATLFDNLQLTAEKQMMGDSLPRFLKSEEWRAFSESGGGGSGQQPDSGAFAGYCRPHCQMSRRRVLASCLRVGVGEGVCVFAVVVCVLFVCRGCIPVC